MPTIDPRIPATGRRAPRAPLLLLLGAGLAAASPAIAAAETSASAAAPLRNGASQIAITLTDKDGGTCQLDHTEAKAGPVTFRVTNLSATAITEVEVQTDDRVLGETENLAPGLPPVSLTLTLGGGKYRIFCPGAAQNLVSFTVTGKAAAAPDGATAALLAQGASDYATYVDGQIDAMVGAVSRLATAIDAGDLAAARAAYPVARPFYERIESDVEGFVLPGFKPTDNAGNLDYLIDMRASNLDPAVGWHGFHAIERDLFETGKITPKTRALAAELLPNVQKLRTRAKALQYKPLDLANGAAGLLEEVQNGKISGEEEAYSHYDLVDFAANVEGAQKAFSCLEPGLRRLDPGLTARIAARFAEVTAELDRYRDPAAPGGFVRYTAEVRSRDAARLSRAVQALQEPLSQIAEKVAAAQ